jgi:type VI secretion system secreted protein VgrG
LTAEQHRSGGGGGEQIVHLEAVPDDVQWNALPLTPRPIVRGPETAIVTGPSGEEIYTDQYGRIKVRFHWDRSDSEGERSTCWIRVSQTGGLGNIILPRVGHEVVVDFLDGNPDRPLVVGRVFNKANMPIYPLPDNKTRALWRTKRYGEAGSYGAAKALDTGSPGANELRFEDKGGHEEVFLHAERDMTLRVRHSESHHIGLDQAIDIGGSRDVKIKEADSNDVGKSIKVKAGTTINIEAGTSITLKVGQTSMVLDQTSVSIKTTQFKTEAQATVDVKSPMTTVKGDGMLTLKGGVTMIN